MNPLDWYYCFRPDPEIGMLRETFFQNQAGVDHSLTFPDKGDFLLDGEQLFEIGGKSKDWKKLDKSQAWLALDGIETGHGRTIPLWMFGFLY